MRIILSSFYSSHVYKWQLFDYDGIRAMYVHIFSTFDIHSAYIISEYLNFLCIV